jgi:hypothetical protein
LARRLARAFAAILPVCALASGSASAHGYTISQLRVTPSEGHAGDTIDLSGSGFPAFSHLNILMACPSWQAEKAVQLGNVVIMAGPTTNINGQFSGFLFRAIQLHGIPFSTCQIQASVGDNPFGVDIPAVYLIRQRSQPLKLKPCRRHLCVQQLQVEPHQIRSGYDETVSLRTWPGALVTTTYMYPDNRQTTDYHRADWTGIARWTKHITGVAATGPVQVRAVATLGSMSSALSTTRFTIVH